MARNAEVDAWFVGSDHPLKAALARVRQIVLGADKRVDECVKWKSPTFVYQGNIASLNPNTKKKVSLMFHKGASLPGTHAGLEGGAGTVKFMYFDDLADVNARRGAIESAIRAWCKMMSGRKAQPGASSKSAASATTGKSSKRIGKASATGTQKASTASNRASVTKCGFRSIVDTWIGPSWTPGSASWTRGSSHRGHPGRPSWPLVGGPGRRA
jgi:hypothetical protein